MEIYIYSIQKANTEYSHPMAMNTALRRLLPLLLLILPPPLRHYLSAPPSDHGGATEQLQVYHPIILFPGFSCSNLEVRLTDAYTPSVPRCGVLKGKGWFPLWKNPWDLLRHDYVPCFEEQMTLVFDPALNDYRNLPGVETRVPDFGSAYGFISKNDAHNMSCMIRLREQLEALGYHDKDTLFGAPYDIRHAPPPSGQPSQVYSDYFDRVKDLVQHASEKNGNKPVILVGHSFGARVILDFLNSTSVPWRQKLIKHIVVISPTPSTGFTLVATNLASGPDVIIGVPTVSPLALRPMWRSFTSPFLSLPSPTIFGHKPLVITKNKNYSAYDYPHFLAALGFGTDGVVAFMKRMLPTMLRVDAPMVPTTYLNGAGIQTTEQVVYWEGNFDIAPEIVHGDGDGCINMVSVLAFVKELHRQQRRNNIPFKFVKINHATHSDILSREHSLRVIMTELLEANC